MGIDSRAKFYHDRLRSTEEAEAYKTKRQKRIKQLESQLRSSRQHWHTQQEKLLTADKRIKELENEIKHLRYDNTNLKEDMKRLRKYADDTRISNVKKSAQSGNKTLEMIS